MEYVVIFVYVYSVKCSCKQHYVAFVLTLQDFYYIIFKIKLTLTSEKNFVFLVVCNTGCPKKIVPFSKILLFGGRHLENFVPMGTAGISIKTRSI